MKNVNILKQQEMQKNMWVFSDIYLLSAKAIIRLHKTLIITQKEVNKDTILLHE